MGIYKTLCYKVEDLMVKLITKKEDPLIVKEKVTKYRFEKEQLSHQRKLERNKKLEEQRQLKQQQREQQERKRIEKEELERKEIESLVSKLMRNTSQSYNSYEFNEIKRNKHFFQSLYDRVLEPNEKLETFIFCKYDKSSKKEIKGYLLPTNKRVLFLTKNLNFMDKFRYQTIINVNWFKDGLLERGLRIQYGKRKLEFDEMYDHEQLMKVGNIILNNSKTGTK
ncbi:PH domain-containing protein [Bacillus litorisediminis]|uniref:PH domain-containing protein n=1 Tax=Bacillus litorisediminis TaxID=2922713 RepID=UPI001FAC58B1|nr:PH domain-containing protein [Bacillus litorisediminis]